MANTDLDGSPMLILSYAEAKILNDALDSLGFDSNNSRVKYKLESFLNDPRCIEWENKCHT
jgi:hypothetical protein